MYTEGVFILTSRTAQKLYSIASFVNLKHVFLQCYEIHTPATEDRKKWRLLWDAWRVCPTYVQKCPRCHMMNRYAEMRIVGEHEISNVFNFLCNLTFLKNTNSILYV